MLICVFLLQEESISFTTNLTLVKGKNMTLKHEKVLWTITETDIIMNNHSLNAEYRWDLSRKKTPTKKYNYLVNVGGKYQIYEVIIGRTIQVNVINVITSVSDLRSLIEVHYINGKQ